jgi:hypothetical protein
MVKTVQGVRACLAAGVFLCVGVAAAQAQEACSAAWHAEAEKAMAQGKRLLHGWGTGDRVRLWRLLTLGEDAPAGDRDLNVAGKWNGTSEETLNSYDFMTGEAVMRGVSWSLQRAQFSQPDFNVWFAAKLFEERRQLLGDKHPYLRQWLENQSAVFTKPDTVLIDASTQHQGVAAEVAADDIQYQRAAQRFYAEDYDTAADGFRAVAMQPASRYRSIAAYMTARSLAHAERFDDALAEIAAIERDPSFEDVRLIADQLLGVMSWNSWGPDTPQAPMRESSRRLLLSIARTALLPLDAFQSDPSSRKHYWQAIHDLQLFLKSDGARGWTRGKFDDDWWLDPSRDDELGSWMAGLALAATENELLDWLQSMEQVQGLAAGPWLGYWSDRTSLPAFRAAAQHVHQRAEATKSLAWIIADAMWSTTDNTLAASMLSNLESKRAACAAGQAELLALPMLRYHVARVRIISDSGFYSWDRRGAAYIDQLGTLDTDTRSAATQFLMAVYGNAVQYPPSESNDAAMRRLLSTSLEEFLPAQDPYETIDGFSAVINMLPIRILVQIAAGDTLSEKQRAEIARMAWTRAYLLKDEVALRQATELLSKLNPGLSRLVDAYRDAWTYEGRERAALMLLLKTPSMQLLMPARQDLGWRYGATLKRYAERPGRWSWFLTPDETTDESIDLFWADAGNRNDKNWWCQAHIVRLQARLERDFYNQPLALVPDQWARQRSDPRAHPTFSTRVTSYLADRRTKFLTEHPVLQLVDWEELGKLSKVPPAPHYLTQAVMAWVNDANWLDRWLYEDEMAKALALAVRTTRFGCTNDGPNRADSLAAYQLLHQHFPDSEAARRTRYWYD